MIFLFRLKPKPNSLKQKLNTGGGRKGMQSHGVTRDRMKDITLKTSDGPLEAVCVCVKKNQQTGPKALCQGVICLARVT